MPKKINIYCSGPISISKKYKSLWEDINLYWRIKPGRKNQKYICPTFISKTDLKNEINNVKEMLNEKEENKDIIEFLNQEKQFLEKVLKELEKEKIFIEESKDKELPIIYTFKDYLNKNEVERMSKKLLNEYYDLNNVVFKWKRPKFFVLTC